VPTLPQPLSYKDWETQEFARSPYPDGCGRQAASTLVKRYIVFLLASITNSQLNRPGLVISNVLTYQQLS